MELDQLKNAWQSLDRRLERQNSLSLQLLKDDRTRQIRTSLRPLFWGQLAQMGFGLLFVLMAATLWLRAGSLPAGLSWQTVMAGVLVHVYGVAAIALAGSTMGLIRGIDYAAPVLAIQKQLARLRRFHILSGMIVGLPWWFMWVPVLMVLAGLAGADLHARAPSVTWIGLGVGVAGLLATWWLHRWSRSTRRPASSARAMQDSISGGSLRNARRIAEEIARFEKE